MDDRSAAKTSPPGTPLDVRLGLTNAEDVAFPLRWGILGAGEISRQFVHAVRACEGATVTAVAAREADRARQFAQQHNIKSSYGDYAAMVASPDVDIVYIGTVPEVQKDQVILAAEAGKHVLCEKPFSANLDEARAMYAAAETNNVMVQHGLWTRFFPAVEHARHAIEIGEIGEVLMVQADLDRSTQNLDQSRQLATMVYSSTIMIGVLC
jgi:predicted dehydrogenase